MKKSLIILVFISTFFASCNTAALYNTEQCPIRIHIDEGSPTASYILADFTPIDNRMYYFCGIVTSEEYYKHSNDQRFMQMYIDYQYMEYIVWRYSLLEAEEEYIADFSSHCLSYGEDSRYFRNLKAETEYVIFAFCVNPENNQPIGNLYHIKVTTDKIRQTDLTFQVMFKERDEGTYVSMMPSNDDDTYLWEWEDQQYLKDNNLTIEQYADALIKSWQEYGLADYMYSQGPQSYKCVEGDLTEGHKYILIATGYDGSFTTKLYHLEFEYPFPTEDPIPLVE